MSDPSADAPPVHEQAELVVDFVGDVRTLVPGDELTFGRAADLVVDENRYLHRVVGRFRWSNGVWWLTNVGSSIPISVADRHSTSYTKIAPGASAAMSFGAATLSFEAGGRPYELVVDVRVEPPSPDEDHPPSDDTIEATTTTASLPLTPEQHLLLVALAEPRLRDHAGGELPTNREIASKLGWTITKFNRKLDGLCQKYAAAGVAGLRGSSDSLARDRRVRLMEHALHAGIVSTDDLELLDRATGG